jgi:G3E family GTPase
MTLPPVLFTARRRDNGRLPVTLVTGFLGSGKTTLVNHILTNRRGVRAAVLVNELGAIGIDNDLIVDTKGRMIELSNGCICCSINNDLVDGIVRVLSRPEPVDHLLVETTGIADPLPVALTFQRPEFRDLLRLDAIVALADAEQFRSDLFDSAAARNQLRHADVVLLNKCDLVDEEKLRAVEGGIRSVTQAARLVRTTRSAVPLPLILDVDSKPIEPASGYALPHDDGFISLSFESDRPFLIAPFQTFLDHRPPGLFRGKGFLWFAETEKRYVFHLVGDRFTLDDDPRPVRGSNRLVLIGRGLDAQHLQIRLGQCLASPPQSAFKQH